MGIGESVKKGFAVAGQSMNLVLTLFVFGAVWNLINVTLAPQVGATPEAAPAAGVSAVMIAAGIIFILLSFYVQAGSLGYVSEKLKTGQAALPAFFASGARYYVRLLLLGLLVAAIVGTFILAAGLLIALLAGALNILGIILGSIVAAIGIYFVILMFLAPYYIVAGDGKVIPSIKNSIGMVRKHLLTVLGIAIILILIGFGLGILLGVVFALLSVALKGAVSQIVFAVLSSFVNAFLGVLVTGSFMNFYLKASGNTGGAE
ncbi:MAG: hypothetical protein ACREH5_06680 [Candidatus Omnitrophota bacterium]